MTEQSTSNSAPWFSVAIFAWNEEAIIESALEMLLAQSAFAEMARRNLRAEVICVVNGSTDRTAELAGAYAAKVAQSHACAEWLSYRVVNITERGKLNAWNRYVHQESAPSARYLCMMDADIQIEQKTALWSMIEALEQDSQAHISVDLPRKDIETKKRRSLRDRVSLGASGITRSAQAQLCAQLYCIRAEVARRIYFPRHLPACEDGLLKALVCTDFLAHQANPKRICQAEGASHTFEAYTRLPSLLKNQKRQVIGQTVVHILVDKFLPELPAPDRSAMASTIVAKENADPQWLKKLIAAHVSNTRGFWNVCPGYVGTGLRRWSRVPGIVRKAVLLPAAVGHFGITLAASYLAWRALRAGSIDYWPRAERRPQDLSDTIQLTATPAISVRNQG